MPNRLIFEQLTAELATLNNLISSLPADDVLGRLGLESRREEIQRELGTLRANPETVASIALMFGGRPVLGSRGIEAAFASEVVAKFQDLVTNVWGTAEGADLGARGPVPDREQSQLHITSLLHGSVGFLLQELNAEERLFDSPLKHAADRAAEVLHAFAGEDEQGFAAVLEAVDQRVLGSTRDLLRQLYRSGATVRMVEGERELDLTGETIGRAYSRAENAAIEESEDQVTGVLLGLIPFGRKFEMRTDAGSVLSGSVAPTLSEAYLRRLTEEDLVGNRCQGRIRRKRVTRFGRVSESVTLLDLHGVN